jgi:cysteinyl-tRNA synthetase
MPLRIYDPIRGVKRDFVPREPGKVGMYVCGMTVQDEPHLGHMFAFLAGDVMRRFLESCGFEVRYVLNFTDVDDKIIVRAEKEGVPYQQISERNIAAFFRFADLLNIRRATVHPRATEHIAEIQAMIASLIEKDRAYASAGDVYFDVASFPGYGKISGRRIDDLRSGARIEPGENKRSPLDFALWKAAKPGEPYWDSPWGHGRPGWHIECSAMSKKHLGECFDLHGGGIDLIFPHHENEAAQSEAASGIEPVNFWVRNGMLRLAGEKMSKSTGHFLRVADVSERVDPRALRLYLISSHFRSPLDYSEDRIEEARQGLARFETFFRNLALATSPGQGAAEAGTAGTADDGFTAEIEAAGKGFREAMEDDFNSARGLGHLFDAVRGTHRYLEGGGAVTRVRAAALERAGTVIREGLGILGVQAEMGGGAAIPEHILQRAQEREAARRARNWALADQIREEIKNQGFTIEDRDGGPVIVRSG